MLSPFQLRQSVASSAKICARVCNGAAVEMGAMMMMMTMMKREWSSKKQLKGKIITRKAEKMYNTHKS